jgi:hypothetical protein
MNYVNNSIKKLNAKTIREISFKQTIRMKISVDSATVIDDHAIASCKV